MDKRHINKNGQGAVEFVVLAGVLLFFFIMILGILSLNTKTFREEKQDLLAEDILTKVQKEVQLANLVEDGYRRDFRIPEKINRKDYNISIISNSVIISVEGETYSRRLPNITGNLTIPDNIITKKEGRVYLNGN